MPMYNLNINGKQLKAEVADDTPLLWVLRDHLGLLGTKYACGIATCGACTVHTIEGLSATGEHPLQKAWDEIDVPQCGYCQTGQIMTAAAFLKKNPNPSDKEIVEAMNSNICRCGTYHRIKDAVKMAAKNMK
jgi:isoquinoline 1-oxidoreductase subunit alpha